MEDDILTKWLGDVVVLDVAAPFVYLGTLQAVGPRYLTLTEADAHDLRDSTTTRDLYVLDARKHGVSGNRRQVLVSREQVISLSRLADVQE
ncbi:MAG: hypothetical protein R3B90_15395 [Planctomycetaceae bacterium]